MSEEGVAHRGLCPGAALKQEQCETKEEIEGEALAAVAQCEENSALLARLPIQCNFFSLVLIDRGSEAWEPGSLGAWEPSNLTREPDVWFWPVLGLCRPTPISSQPSAKPSHASLPIPCSSIPATLSLSCQDSRGSIRHRRDMGT